VKIDYSKKTAFTLGAVKTNFGRFPLNEKLRFLTRAAVRHVVGRQSDGGSPFLHQRAATNMS
jgi:hypothetical protein